jgi:hypothetical protein
MLDLSLDRIASAVDRLAERRVTGHASTPLGACTTWFDLEHDGVTTRVHYPTCVMPDTVTACPRSEVTVVGYAVGPTWVEATAVLGEVGSRGRCPR